MAARNRTVLFRNYRDALKSVRVPTFDGVTPSTTSSFLHPSTRRYAPLSTEDPATSGKGAMTVGLPPAWVDLSEEVGSNIQRARLKMAKLAKAHAKALMPSFGDGKEDQHRIESLTYEITDLIKRSEKRLQRLSSARASEDSNIRKNVQRSLATDLQSLSVELRKKQSEYLKRLKQQKEAPDGVDFEMSINEGKSKALDDDFDDPIFNEQRLARIKKNEAFTLERDREIQQVVESVNELAQIMKDLSVLVIDQVHNYKQSISRGFNKSKIHVFFNISSLYAGTIIDRVDYNIQNVASSVEQGLKQLQK